MINGEINKFKLPSLENLEGQDNREDIQNAYNEQVVNQKSNIEKKEKVLKNNPDFSESQSDISESKNIEDSKQIVVSELSEKIKALLQTIDDKIISFKGEENKINIELEDIKDNLNNNEVTEQLSFLENKINQLLEQNIDNEIVEKISLLIDYGQNLENRINDLKSYNEKLVTKILYKVLDKEISEHSEKIVLNSFLMIYEEIKESETINIYLSEKDFVFLEKTIQKESSIIKIHKDKSIKNGKGICWNRHWRD